MKRLPFVATLLLVLVSCGDGTTGLDEAKAACRAYLPSITGPTAVSHEEVQNALAQARSGLSHAAAAARKDSRWNALNRAYSAMADTWSYDAAYIEPAGTNDQGVPNVTSAQLQTYQGLLASFERAATTARAECAKANA